MKHKREFTTISWPTEALQKDRLNQRTSFSTLNALTMGEVWSMLSKALLMLRVHTCSPSWRQRFVTFPPLRENLRRVFSSDSLGNKNTRWASLGPDSTRVRQRSLFVWGESCSGYSQRNLHMGCYLRFFKLSIGCSPWEESRFIWEFLICWTYIHMKRVFLRSNFRCIFTELTCIIKWHSDTTKRSTSHSKTRPPLEPCRLVATVVLYL